jgi:hypothetical protein
MLGQLKDFTAVNALSFEDAASVVQAMRKDMDIGLTPGNQLAVKPDDAVTIIEGKPSHCPHSPGLIVTYLLLPW